MRQNKKTKAQATDGKLTIYPAPTTMAELNSRFAESVGKPRDGANAYINSFVVLMDRLLATNPRAFSFPDAVNINTAFEIPIRELERLFNAYVETLQRWQVIDMVIGCYEYPVFARR